MRTTIKQKIKEFCLSAKSRPVRLVFDLLLRYKSAHSIPLTNYARAHETIRVHLQNELSTVLGFSTDFESELYVRRFEADFARLCSRRFAVGTHSGTSALQLSLIALNIGVGDEVITVPNTYIATALAISNTDATPVFVDIDEKTFNIDAQAIEQAITNRTKAIVPVHLYGQMANMPEVNRIAKAHNLKVIEDACQAFGAELHGCKAGSMGDVGCFSFSTPKNLSGLGSGGMVVSDDRSLIEKIRLLRNPESNCNALRQSRRTPCYLNAIQVAFIRAKLPMVHKWTENRRAQAERYRSALKNVDVILPSEAEGAKHSYYRFVIRTKRRNELEKWLKMRGVSTAIPYSPSLHLTRTYSYLDYSMGSFPRTEAAEREILSLPISPFLTDDEIGRVLQGILDFFAGQSQ